MSEAFEIRRPGKMLDYLEGQVTEWAFGLIEEHFGVDSPDELTRDQIDEVIDQWNELLESSGLDFLALGLRNAISQWENEHDDYII
ncbi:hypothetical protein N8344_00725 [bacterium]|nr:hypothetical protein [bacterium]